MGNNKHFLWYVCAQNLCLVWCYIHAFTVCSSELTGEVSLLTGPHLVDVQLTVSRPRAASHLIYPFPNNVTNKIKCAPFPPERR